MACMMRQAPGQDGGHRCGAGRNQVPQHLRGRFMGGQSPAEPEADRLAGETPMSGVDRGAQLGGRPFPARQLERTSGIGAWIAAETVGHRGHRQVDALGGQMAVVVEEPATGKGIPASKELRQIYGCEAVASRFPVRGERGASGRPLAGSTR